MRPVPKGEPRDMIQKLSDEEALQSGFKYCVTVWYDDECETYHLHELRSALGIYCRAYKAGAVCDLKEADGNRWVLAHRHDL